MSENPIPPADRDDSDGHVERRPGQRGERSPAGSTKAHRMFLPRRVITFIVAPLLLATLALIAGAGGASASAYYFHASGSPGTYYVDYGTISCSGSLEASYAPKISIPGGLVTQSPRYGNYYQVVHETLGVAYWNGARWVNYDSYPVASGTISGGADYANYDAVRFGTARVAVARALVNHYVRIAVTLTWYATSGGAYSNSWQVAQSSYYYSNNTYVGANAGPGYCLLGG